jgi:two-component system CheB/CheR fusion protein
MISHAQSAGGKPQSLQLSSFLEHPVSRRGRYKRSKKAMSFPIVGIGASAGGLESFSELIARVPAEMGMAYVFVQHLDPRHGSLLVSLLSKRAGIPVEEAREGVKILCDHLYVIAPNTTLTISGYVLHLRSRDPAERPHRPVDMLFHSLAERRRPNVIGIILSGCGSDGAKGIQAIKQAGGMTFAQAENSARFFGMPSSAIQTGCVDFILVPGEIAQELIRTSRRLRGTGVVST